MSAGPIRLEAIESVSSVLTRHRWHHAPVTPPGKQPQHTPRACSHKCAKRPHGPKHRIMHVHSDSHYNTNHPTWVLPQHN